MSCSTAKPMRPTARDPEPRARSTTIAKACSIQVSWVSGFFSMALGVFIHKPESICDDVPFERYQLPKRYLNSDKQCVGDRVACWNPEGQKGPEVTFRLPRFGKWRPIQSSRTCSLRPSSPETIWISASRYPSTTMVMLSKERQTTRAASPDASGCTQFATCRLQSDRGPWPGTGCRRASPNGRPGNFNGA